MSSRRFSSQKPSQKKDSLEQRDPPPFNVHGQNCLCDVCLFDTVTTPGDSLSHFRNIPTDPPPPKFHSVQAVRDQELIGNWFTDKYKAVKKGAQKASSWASRKASSLGSKAKGGFKKRKDKGVMHWLRAQKDKVSRNLRGGAERAYCNANPMHNANETQKSAYKENQTCEPCSEPRGGTRSARRNHQRKCERACKNKKEEAREDAVAACQRRSRRKQQRVRDEQSDARNDLLESQRLQARQRRASASAAAAAAAAAAAEAAAAAAAAQHQECVENFGEEACT